MESAILGLNQTRALLQQLEHTCKTALGQNFLVDANIVRKSLQQASITAGDIVVEIGPGLGTLTGALLGAGAQVYAIEKDNGLYSYLQGSLKAAHQDSFFLMQGDAVQQPLAALPEAHCARFKIVANLPYAISTPWMEKVLWGPLPHCMVLMLQREAALRFISEPGQKAYGPITLLLSALFSPQSVYPVSARCFYPSPDVESMLLCLERKATRVPFSPETYTLIRTFFCYRRKQLGSIAKKIGVLPLVEGWLDRIGVSLQERPENIPLEGWLAFGR